MDDLKDYKAPLGAFQLLAQEYVVPILFGLVGLALLLDRLGV